MRQIAQGQIQQHSLESVLKGPNSPSSGSLLTLHQICRCYPESIKIASLKYNYLKLPSFSKLETLQEIEK